MKLKRYTWDTWHAATRKPRSVMLSALLLVALSACSGCRPTSPISPAGARLVMAEVRQGDGLAVMTDDGTVWCIRGRVGYVGHRLKAGQAYRDRLYQFSVEEFLLRFPSYR